MFLKKPQQPAEKPAKPQGNANVSITDAGPCQRALRVQVGLEAIAPVRAVVVEEFCKRVTLPGFRKGKAPADLVAQRHAQPIQEETLQRVTKQTLEQVVKDHQLRPISPFQLSRVDYDATSGLALEATVEVEPSFKLGDYKGIRLTKEPVTVSPEEIEQGLASIQESSAQLVPKGEGQPKEKKVPALDEELAKDVGFESLEKLKIHIEAKLREQKQRNASSALEGRLCDALLQRHAFEVPPNMVTRQAERSTRDFKARLLLSGMAEEKVETEMKSFADRLRQNAESHVKLGFILDRIASEEAVEVKEQEVVSRLWQVAQQWKKDPVEVRKIFDAERLWPSVISTIQQEKTMALLMHAAVRDDGEGG